MYIPIPKRDEYKNLQSILKDYRKPNPKDAHTIQNNACVMEVSGSGKNSVYQCFRLTRVDFASVTDKQALYAYAINEKGDHRIVITKSPLRVGKVWIKK